MMRHIVIVILALSFILPANLSARTFNTEAVDALVKAYGTPDAPGISVAVAQHGEVVYEGWTGIADLERRTAIDHHTRFHIASISKQFTAYAIHRLAKEGKLQVDQPLSDFFPEFEASTGELTIRHLLDHTGGLREVNSLVQMLGLSESSPITADQMLAVILRQESVNFEPGTDEEYSNTGYQLLAHIVAKSSGQSFADYMQNEIFSPLEMDHSIVRIDPQAMIRNVAVSYENTGQSFIHTPILATAFGSTGIVSTPRDLLKWGHWLNTQELAGAPVMRAMAERARLPDGRSVVAGNGQEFRLFRGVKTWSHGGTAGGFKSFLLRIPDHGIVIAVAGNRADFLKAAFAFDVAEAVLGATLEPAPEPDMTPETKAELDSYAGDYELFPGTVFSLRREGETLTFASYGEEAGFPLPRISKGVFLLNPVRDTRLVFRDFEAGKATQMRWQVSEDGYLRALRVEMEPLSEEPLDFPRYVGTFYSTELMMGLEFTAKEGGLLLASSLNKPVPLIQYQPSVFRPDGQVPFARIEFVPGSNGQMETVRIGNPLIKGIDFKRQD